MLRFLSIGVLILSSTAALAEGPSYSYIQAAYKEIDLDIGDLDTDGDGYEVTGSVAINQTWFVFAGYASFDLDSPFRGDADRLEIAGGGHWPISSTTDWFVTASYLNDEYGSSSEDGFGVGGGIRSMFTPSLELYAQANYEDVVDDEFSLGGGAWYTVTGNLALGAVFDFGDNISTYGVGIRLYFDK